MSTEQNPPPAYLEDFEVGARQLAPAAPIGDGDGDGRVRGAVVAAAFAGSPLASGAETDAAWRYLEPVRADAELRYDVLVTGCRRTPDLTQGVVRRHVRVVDGDGQVIQEGTTTSLVPVRSAVDDSDGRVGRAFGTLPWARALAARLNDDPEFHAQTATWDGTIGIRYGAGEALFRVYRGRVLEAATRTPNGPTYVVEADERDWVELFTGPASDFSKRVMLGQLRVHGNAYEYVRLTAALVAIIDQARAMARSGRNS